ncbi:roquin-1-like [Gigantopelta aegis]|uniref:roquin-1-like n=1 Tax=Gigantopelta aegis TaxID=1735272 RepID=UPI001B887F1F|nr:roquin-1-like [Gigantopelta aegis]
MPVQGPQWTEFLSCLVCFKVFDDKLHQPISLGCSHTVCKSCLLKLQQLKCPFDQSSITVGVKDLPVNNALLQLVSDGVHKHNFDVTSLAENAKYYTSATKCIEDLALLLKPLLYEAHLPKADLDEDCSKKLGSVAQLNCVLSRPMQRKLVTLINCQLLEEEGRSRVMRAARSLGERTVTELILQHQNPQQLSANLWAAVRARGCQFLGPAMQEEVLSLILLALEDGSALSRKVLVLFVVQRLEPQYPHASKTAIGHVVQLLYRASCFKVTKRDEESSLMQLKEEFRTNETLRREHDSQIVEIALEAGLRISPEQWSSLLYGDAHHKSHMQSIIDKLQTPQSFNQSVSELMIALERTGDPCNLQRLRPHLEFLASVDPSPDMPAPSWENLDAVMKAVKTVVRDLFDFLNSFSNRKHELLPLQNARYKTSMCRDLAQKGVCPRSSSCTFAHSQEEIDKYRLRNKKMGARMTSAPTSASLTAKEKVELAEVNRTMERKMSDNGSQSTARPIAVRLEPPAGGQRTDTADKPNPPKKKEDISTSMGALALQSLSGTNGVLPQTPEALALQSLTGTNGVLPQTPDTVSFVPTPHTANRGSVTTTPKEPYVVSQQGPPVEIMPPNGGYQFTQLPYQAAVPPPMYVSRYSSTPAYPYVSTESTAYPNYVSYDGTTLPVSTDQWSQQQQYYPSQTVPYVPGVQALDMGMFGPGLIQPGSHLNSCDQARETLTDLHSRRNEILAKLHQNSQFGCRKPACEPPLYPPKYPVSCVPQQSVGHYGPSAMQTHRSQPSVDMRHACLNERSIVIIDPRTDHPTSLGSCLQERSIVHDGLPPRNVHSNSVTSQAGLLHTTALFTAVTDSVNVAKTSALETSVRWQKNERDDQNTKQKWQDLIICIKSGCPPCLSSTSSGSYVPWSSEECGTSLEEDGGGSRETSFHTTNVSWVKVNHQEGSEVQNEMIKRDYPRLESYIPFYPKVSGLGPISRLSTTAKFKMTEPMHVTTEESMGKMIPDLTGEQTKTCSSSPDPKHFTIEEILSHDMYPIIPAQFSTDDIILRKRTTIGPKSEPQHTWECCIPTSQNYLHEELARLQNKLANASNSDERLAYELQAIEFKISLGLPIQVDIHEKPTLDPKRRLEQMDEHFSQQLIMDEIDAQLLGLIQPRNT